MFGNAYIFILKKYFCKKDLLVQVVPLTNHVFRIHFLLNFLEYSLLILLINEGFSSIFVLKQKMFYLRENGFF